MDKVVELTKLKKEEEKLLIAKVLDKLKAVETKNKFESTDFLDLAKRKLIENILIKRNEKNYEFFGGIKQAERTMLILYSENTYNFVKHENIYNQIMSAIRITLPKELKGTFEHKAYLGAIIKLGIKREKIGDILVSIDGADIIISKDIEKFLLKELGNLTRFRKAKIEAINLEDINYIEKEKKILKINVPSLRLDALVGELARVSRSDANKYIEGERVFINFEEEVRCSKQVFEGDIITIRGKGRFTISKILGETKSKRINLEVEKW